MVIKVRKKNWLFKIKECSLGNLNVIYFFFSFFKKIFVILVLVRIGFESNEQQKKRRTKRGSRFIISTLWSRKIINKKKSVVRNRPNYVSSWWDRSEYQKKILKNFQKTLPPSRSGRVTAPPNSLKWNIFQQKIFFLKFKFSI